jgi:peptidoglycan/LPS O-acetylase OafA/YrhL
VSGGKSRAVLAAGSLKYRPDIDGLRAVAVLAVIGFHAFPQRIPGGFVGVDIFFVISGYLISLVILEDLRSGKFRFRVFYERRVRRIFPALLLVLIATLAFGWFALLKPEFRSLGQRAAGGAAFVSNFLLLDTRGYFAVRSDSEPLLHLWSLAIEEQFYIVWPFVFYIAWSRKWNLLGMVALLTAASLALNLWAFHGNGESFFLPSTRAWELGVGALLAVAAPSLALPAQGVLREWMAAAGLLAMILAILFFNQELPYPGALTLIPVLGAALTIAAGAGAWLNRRLLSVPPLVGCGLISYPLYLWHWPLLSLGHIVVGDGFSARRRGIVVLVSMVLAFLTYAVIEKPIRFGPQGSRKALILLGLMFVAGCVGLMVQGGRVPSASQLHGVDQSLTDKLFAAGEDWAFPGEGAEAINAEQGGFVRYAGRRDRPGVWFFGDSEVQQYGPRISKIIAANPGKFPSAVFTTKGGCPPLPGFAWAKFRPLCNGFFDRATEYAREANISTVVVGAAWPYLADGHTYFYTETLQGADGIEIADVVYRELEQLLLTLHEQGKTVYLLLPIPLGEALDPERMIHRHLSLHPLGVNFAIPSLPGISAGDASVLAIQAQLRMIAARTGSRVIDPYEYLCRNGFCPAFDNAGQPMYKDESHLRATFVREHASFIDRVLGEN